MNAEIIKAIVRHALTIFGGVLAAKYGTDGATIEALVGGGSALAGVAWSIYDKRAK